MAFGRGYIGNERCWYYKGGGGVLGLLGPGVR